MNRFIICLILFIPFQGLSNWQREWDIAIDSSARLSVDEILNGDYFQIKDTAKIKSFGLTSNVIWMKSALDMPEGGSVSLDNPLIRYIDFFLLMGDSIIRHDSFEYQQNRKTGKSELSVLMFDIPQDFKGEMLFRFESSEPLFIKINVVQEEDENVFFAKAAMIGYISAGAVLVLGLLYLIFFISLKDKIYLLYSIYSLTVIITLLRVNGLLYVWFPFLRVLNDYTSIFGSLVSIAVGIFTIYFLQLKKYSKIMLWVIRIMVVLQFVSVIISFLGYNRVAFLYTDFIASLFIPTVIGLSIWLWLKREYKPAKYYLLSFTFLFVGAVVYLLRNYGIIISESIILNHSLDLGIALEMIFLAVGLSKKVDSLRIEKNNLQAENIRILNQKKEELEYLVHERTKMLEAQNEEIIQQQEEITAINDSLEKTVKKRTLQLRIQNEKLLDYAYFNAHKVRGPLARILGLVYLLKLNNTDDIDEMVNQIDESAQELDIVIKEVNTSLTSAEKNDLMDLDEN